MGARFVDGDSEKEWSYWDEETEDVPASSKYPEPWDITSLTSDAITVTRCGFVRGPVTVRQAGSLSCGLTGLTGEVSVCAKINTETHVITLDAEAPDVEIPADPTYMRYALYVLSRATTDDPWAVVEDSRKLQHVTLAV